MDPLFEVDADEPLLMARYLAATGGLWPHVVPAVDTYQSLLRTTSTPAQLQRTSQPLPTLRSRLASDNPCARSAEFPLQEEAFGSDTAEDIARGEMYDGAATEEGADSNAVADCSLPGLVASTNKRRGRRTSPGYTHRIAQATVQPRLRVVDFQVIDELDLFDHEPMELKASTTPPRSGLRSGLSMLLNTPA